MKKILVTHGHCSDGSAAGVIAKAIDENTQIHFGIHRKINEQIKGAANSLEESGTLWITDICCDEDVLIECQKILRKKNASMGIYEHHQTRNWLQVLKPIDDFQLECIYDEDRCGSKIFYDALVKSNDSLNKYKDFIDVINDRDIWLNKDPRGEILVNLHDILGDQQFVERFLKNPSMTFTETEQILLDHTQKEKKNKINKLLNKIETKKDEFGFEYGVFYGEAFSSDLLNEAINRFDLEYAILINLNTKNASIRSRGNLDCADFAQKRGGGGHRCAGGFRVKFKAPQI